MNNKVTMLVVVIVAAVVNSSSSSISNSRNNYGLWIVIEGGRINSQTKRHKVVLMHINYC